MSNDDELARLREESASADRALRKAEREMESVEHALEHRLKQFEHDEQEDARHIREQLRRLTPPSGPHGEP